MTSTPAEHARSRGAWAALRAILAIEAIGGAVLLVLVVRGFFGASDEAIGPRVSLLLAVLAWWGWIAITFVGALRGRHSWVRGSALTNHVLIFAAATGLLQGILGPQVPLGARPSGACARRVPHRDPRAPRLRRDARGGGVAARAALQRRTAADRINSGGRPFGVSGATRRRAACARGRRARWP